MEFHMADPSKLPFPKEPRSDISVNIGGGKGVLIAPHWVLTASHCISSSKDGVTRMTYTNAKGNNVSIMTDKVIRCETQDLALARLSRAAEGRSPLLLVKDGFPVSSKHSQPFLLKKVAGNGVWSEIPARVSQKSKGERFYISSDERHGKAGTSGSPWVIHSPEFGDVLVGITHGSGRVPQVGRVSDWIERTVSSMSGDHVIWVSPNKLVGNQGAKR